MQRRKHNEQQAERRRQLPKHKTTDASLQVMQHHPQVSHFTCGCSRVLLLPAALAGASNSSRDGLRFKQLLRRVPLRRCMRRAHAQKHTTQLDQRSIEQRATRHTCSSSALRLARMALSISACVGSGTNETNFPLSSSSSCLPPPPPPPRIFSSRTLSHSACAAAMAGTCKHEPTHHATKTCPQQNSTHRCCAAPTCSFRSSFRRNQLAIVIVAKTVVPTHSK